MSTPRRWRSRRSRRCASGKTVVRAGAMGKDLFRLDGKHPALVHLAPDLVGPSNSGVVRAGRQGLRRRERGRCRRRRARALYRHRGDHGRGRARYRRRSGSAARASPTNIAPRRGRARHLVLLGAVAVLDAGLARRDAGAQALLSDQRAGHRLRHHLLLGRADDDDGPALHEGGAVSRPSTSTRWCATRRAPRCRSRRATSSIRWD